MRISCIRSALQPRALLHVQRQLAPPVVCRYRPPPGTSAEARRYPSADWIILGGSYQLEEAGEDDGRRVYTDDDDDVRLTLGDDDAYLRIKDGDDYQDCEES